MTKWGSKRKQDTQNGSEESWLTHKKELWHNVNTSEYILQILKGLCSVQKLTSRLFARRKLISLLLWNVTKMLTRSFCFIVLFLLLLELWVHLLVRVHFCHFNKQIISLDCHWKFCFLKDFLHYLLRKKIKCGALLTAQFRETGHSPSRDLIRFKKTKQKTAIRNQV